MILMMMDEYDKICKNKIMKAYAICNPTAAFTFRKERIILEGVFEFKRSPCI